MNSERKNEWLFIGYRLAKDALCLYLVGGFMFLFAETILPGILSQRINFFFLYVGYIALLVGVIVLGRISPEKRERSEEEKKKWNIQMKFFVFGMIFLFLLPIMRNVPIALLPFFGLGTAVVLFILTESFFEKGNE